MMGALAVSVISRSSAQGFAAEFCPAASTKNNRDLPSLDMTAAFPLANLLVFALPE